LVEFGSVAGLTTVTLPSSFSLLSVTVSVAFLPEIDM